MVCDCKDFSQKLLFLSKEILAKENGREQCEIFMRFVTEYIRPNTFRSRSCSHQICSYFFRKLDEFRCRHMKLPAILMDLLTILNTNNCCLRNLVCLWDFKGTPSFSNYREIMWFTRAFSINNDLMKLLLTHGFLSNVPDHSHALTKELGSKLGSFMLWLIYDTPNINFSDLKKQAMELVKRIFKHYENQNSHRRMFLAVTSINAVQCNLRNSSVNMDKKDNSAEECINCLRMYLAGTRDAYLSVFEVRIVLYACFKLVNKLHLFDEYCQEFKKLMPECPAKMEPRKLTHLARCQIRESLKASHLPLPSAIKKLILPDILKSFLSADILDISGKKENAFPQNSVTQEELDLLMSEQFTF